MLAFAFRHALLMRYAARYIIFRCGARARGAAQLRARAVYAMFALMRADDISRCTP